MQHSADCSTGEGVTGAVTAVSLNYSYQDSLLLLGHDVRTLSVLSWTTSSSRLAKIPFVAQRSTPGQARRYSLSDRARARTVVARRAFLTVTGRG